MVGRPAQATDCWYANNGENSFPQESMAQSLIALSVLFKLTQFRRYQKTAL